MFNSKFNKKIIISAALVASCGLAGMANAAVSQDFQKSVSYSDLDLSKQSDQEALYKRLQRASKDVCGSVDFVSDRDLAKAAHTRKCLNTSLNNAVKKVNNKGLTKLHKSS